MVHSHTEELYFAVPGMDPNHDVSVSFVSASTTFLLSRMIFYFEKIQNVQNTFLISQLLIMEIDTLLFQLTPERLPSQPDGLPDK